MKNYRFWDEPYANVKAVFKTYFVSESLKENS